MRNRALKTASVGAVALMLAVSSQAFAQEYEEYPVSAAINITLDRSPLLKSGGDGTQTNDLQKTLTDSPFTWKSAYSGAGGGNVAASDMASTVSGNTLTVNGGVLPADMADPMAQAAAGLDQDITFEGGAVTGLIGIFTVVGISGQSNISNTTQNTTIGQINTGVPGLPPQF